MTREIKYLPLRSLVANADNPKDHDIGMIVESIERFGFNDAVIVDGRTGMLVGGHGRVEALEWMYQDHLKNNRKRPEGVLAQEQSMGPDGDWLVPVQTGWSSKDDAEAMAFIIAVNRAPELGGWNTPKLEEVLLSLGKMGTENLIGTGYDDDDVHRLLARPNIQNGVVDPEAEWAGMPEFNQQDKTSWRSLIVHFKDAAALEAFSKLIGQPLTEKTRSVWHPAAEIETYADKAYVTPKR